MMRLLRWGPMAVADLASEFFETELLRAAIAARGIFGAAMGPWSAGSTALLLLRAAADPHPAGSSSFPRGGMGALTQAMAAAATKAGAEIRTGADVERILVKDGAAAGLVLDRRRRDFREDGDFERRSAAHFPEISPIQCICRPAS